MAKQAISSLTVDALLKLRGDIDVVLRRKADELKGQLSRMAVLSGASTRQRRGGKVAPKYRGSHGETWAGRGAQPRWLTAEIKKGKKRDDFLIDKSGVRKSPVKRRPARKK
jgi:DNA-binding protein H-NS